MVYIMNFYVDGGCRGNGRSWAFGAAAACLMWRWNNKYSVRSRHLDTDDYPATNQRAELLAMIVALEWALEKYDDLNGYPTLNVTIHSDSAYAVGCMSDWIDNWSRNGWRNARGQPVGNRDLIVEASALDDRLQMLGNVNYVHVPRADNVDADRECNRALDEQENSDSSDIW